MLRTVAKLVAVVMMLTLLLPAIGLAENQPYKGTTITVGANAGWIKGETDRQLAEAFEQETGIHVEFQLYPSEQYDNVLKAMLATDEAPDIFMVMGGSALLPSWSPDKYMLDLSDQPWASEYEDWTVDANSYDGKIVLMTTWGRDGDGMIYDSELFEANGWAVPNTYDEFMALCAKIVEAGYTPMFEPGAEDWHAANWIIACSAGVESVNPGIMEKIDKGEIKMADVPNFVQCVERLNAIAEAGYFQDDFLAGTWGEFHEAMASGKYAMAQSYSAVTGEIAQQYPESGGIDKWKMFPVPLTDDMHIWAIGSTGVGRAVYSKTKNREAVLEYLNFLARPDNLATFYAARSDLQAPMLKTAMKENYMSYNSMIEFVGGRTDDLLNTAVHYISTGLLGKAVQEMWTGGKTPKQVLEAMDADRAKTMMEIGG